MCCVLRLQGKFSSCWAEMTKQLLGEVLPACRAAGVSIDQLEWKPHKQTFGGGCGPFALQTKGKC